MIPHFNTIFLFLRSMAWLGDMGKQRYPLHFWDLGSEKPAIINGRTITTHILAWRLGREYPMNTLI